jgi:hypothetical protein
MTGMTPATVACTICGDQQAFLGSQWEVTVAAQVWEKTARTGAPHTMARRPRSGFTRRKTRKDQRRGAGGRSVCPFPA